MNEPSGVVGNPQVAIGPRVRRTLEQLRIRVGDNWDAEDPATERRILRNAVKCDLCGYEIESCNRWDFVTCQCGNVSVDGGLDYLKRNYSTAAYTELAEVIVE